MSDYDDDDLDEEVESEAVEQEEGAAPANNRNFLMALGILGGIFLLLIIGLAVLYLTRPRTSPDTANIDATNQAIYIANTQTAGAATQAANLLLTPSATLTPTVTQVPPTATNTRVVAQPSATDTLAPGAAALITVTPNIQTRTATLGAVLTQNAKQTLTRTAAIRLTLTATALPTTGFAEDVGLPGLFGLAVGLVLLIVLVRRLRLTSQ
jgi:hypothetical protein